MAFCVLLGQESLEALAVEAGSRVLTQEPSAQSVTRVCHSPLPQRPCLLLAQSHHVTAEGGLPLASLPALSCPSARATEAPPGAGVLLAPCGSILLPVLSPCSLLEAVLGQRHSTLLTSVLTPDLKLCWLPWPHRPPSPSSPRTVLCSAGTVPVSECSTGTG